MRIKNSTVVSVIALALCCLSASPHFGRISACHTGRYAPAGRKRANHPAPQRLTRRHKIIQQPVYGSFVINSLIAIPLEVPIAVEETRIAD